MKRRWSIAIFASALTGATLIFWFVIHQISGLWLDVALRPEVMEVLQHSMDDQKKLRESDAAHGDEYRVQFEKDAKLMHRLEVIRLNRELMLRRFEFIFVAMFAVVAAMSFIGLWSRLRRAQRLERQQYLDRVSDLQQTARRHAHEIKGPLTAARLQLDRLEDAVREGTSEDEVTQAIEGVSAELESLSRFTHEYMTFAATGTPVQRPLSLRMMADEFCATFGNAWPGIRLRAEGGDGTVCADRDMLRQVLLNLCTNSARAMIDGPGSITLGIQRNGHDVVLDVIDTGSGIAESLRERVFDPYVTTRNVGEGMGLGLAISRKIMLDHGGDLQLLTTSGEGSTFRLTFGDRECN
jgi:signal transduction histidine kinase